MVMVCVSVTFSCVMGEEIVWTDLMKMTVVCIHVHLIKTPNILNDLDNFIFIKL